MDIAPVVADGAVGHQEDKQPNDYLRDCLQARLRRQNSPLIPAPIASIEAGSGVAAGTEMVFESMVTEPTCANALPLVIVHPVVRVTLAAARICPAN